jgi:two-component system, NarL family, invasion response regulator UvrY
MRILLVDDHAIVRQSLEYIIHEEFPGASCVECADGETCISSLKKEAFDLVVLDMNLPDMDGMNIAEWILDRDPKQMILFFSSSPTEVFARRLYQMGIMGYINKQRDLSEVAKALRRILIEKKQYIDEEFKSQLTMDLFSVKESNPIEGFSVRELSIAKMLANGKTFEEIASQLNVENSTVRTYKTRIFQKLGVSSLHDFLSKAKLYKLL